ncbi:MAG TPA: HD domain-containing phosphohydrolase [Blastocatellia bacterium]|nr:HD domain-containing phosphohydrolase [Blastocatellia bacterium]
MGEQTGLTFNNLGEVHTRSLGAGTFTIGRHEDNDIVFDNPYISRYHAEIISEGSRHLIRDLGSTSGTFANGERITQRRLKNGDCIRLGRGRGVEFQFHSSDSNGGSDNSDDLRPIRIIAPEETLFINTGRLPHPGDLDDETIDRLRALYEFTSELLLAQSTEDLSDKLTAFIHRTVTANRCAVLLWNAERRALEVTSECGAKEVGPPSRSITDLAYNDNVAVLSMDASTDARFSEGESIKFGSIRSVMCAPMGSKSRLWGVCYVDNAGGVRAFDDESLDFLTAVARQAGLAMENLYLLDEQKRSLESFIRTLAASLDARDDTTAGHSARVGAIASGVAREMGLSAEDSRAVYYAGLLHDYGKIGVRDDVLLKPGGLTPEEYAHVKQHPQHTYRLLSKMRFPEDLADIPLVAASHHERWDGSGYPCGLKGEQIPLGSRIVAIADAYDAVTEERCYNEPMTPQEALSELTSASGTYFDPEVFEAFSRYFVNVIEPRNRRLSNRTAIKEMVLSEVEKQQSRV